MNFLLIFLSAFMAWVTFSLIKLPSVTPTRASSFLSLLGIVLLFFLNNFLTFDLEQCSLLIFGASFVGMCSHKIFKDIEVLLAGLIFALVYIFLAPQVYGVGGALGFSAFVSVVFTRIFFRLLKCNKGNVI